MRAFITQSMAGGVAFTSDGSNFFKPANCYFRPRMVRRKIATSGSYECYFRVDVGIVGSKICAHTLAWALAGTLGADLAPALFVSGLIRAHGHAGQIFEFSPLKFSVMLKTQSYAGICSEPNYRGRIEQFLLQLRLPLL